ncbi:histidine phosphatase family protein [Candidatus Micrarchaeota archaeon]|nr:histidine phosphatase family protein [Candidatus Micrarchaeota archaeon]
MVCKVFIVRHCQSVANIDRIYNCRAHEDEGLSELGFKQANELGLILAAHKITKIYSSPFKRTLQTAQHIADASGATIEVVDAFGELDCGEWDKRSELEIKDEFPDAWKGWHYDPQNNPIPGGESLIQVQARVLPMFEKLVKKNGNDVICIVTHYCVLNVLLCSLVSSLASFRSFDTQNGTIAELNLENVPRLVRYSTEISGRIK